MLFKNFSILFLKKTNNLILVIIIFFSTITHFFKLINESYEAGFFGNEIVFGLLQSPYFPLVIVPLYVYWLSFRLKFLNSLVVFIKIREGEDFKQKLFYSEMMSSLIFFIFLVFIFSFLDSFSFSKLQIFIICFEVFYFCIIPFIIIYSSLKINRYLLTILLFFIYWGYYYGIKVIY